MNILVNFATRSRPSRFIRVMDKLLKYTAQRDKMHVLVKCDVDDYKMAPRALGSFIKKFNQYSRATVKWGDRTNKVGAINRDIESIQGWDVLVNISDDMIPNLHAWDDVLRKAASDSWPDTDFFAHFSDGRVNERLCTLSILGRAYYQRDQYVYHPLYKSFSCDAEAMYVAMMRGKHKYFEPVLFRHDHPAYIKEANDQLYKENSKHSTYDEKLYWERLNRYFDVPEAERCCVPFEEYITKTL
jgi:hypothetical protein